MMDVQTNHDVVAGASEADGAGGAPRPEATRTALLGLLVMVASPVVAALGDPSVLVYAAPFILVPAIGAFLVSRFGRWSHGLAAVLGLAGLAAALPGVWVFTDAPDSFFDVVPAAMFLVGGLLAVVGGVAGAVGRWRERTRRVRPAAVVAVVAVAVLSAVLAVVTASDVDADALAAATEVRVDERGFDPERLQLPAGETVSLALRNDGRIAHTFTSDALGVDIALSPGEVVLTEVSVPGDIAGLQFWCVPHSQVAEGGRREWMVGELAAGD